MSGCCFKNHTICLAKCNVFVDIRSFLGTVCFRGFVKMGRKFISVVHLERQTVKNIRILLYIPESDLPCPALGRFELHKRFAMPQGTDLERLVTDFLRLLEESWSCTHEPWGPFVQRLRRDFEVATFQEFWEKIQKQARPVHDALRVFSKKRPAA